MVQGIKPNLYFQGGTKPAAAPVDRADPFVSMTPETINKPHNTSFEPEKQKSGFLKKALIATATIIVASGLAKLAHGRLKNETVNKVLDVLGKPADLIAEGFRKIAGLFKGKEVKEAAEKTAEEVSK